MVPHTRKPKYANADDLLANCRIVNDCFIWPEGATHPVPTLSPVSPLAKLFYTTSVPRILFTICRRIPSKGRLVHCCPNNYCINPYHYAEASAVRKKRMKQGHPNALLPEQESSRAMIAPPDEVIIELRPSNKIFTNILANSAATAGLDGRGVIGPDGRFRKFKNQNIPYASDDKPLFKLTRLPPKRPELSPEREAELRREIDEFFSPKYLDNLQEAKKPHSPADLQLPEWAAKIR